MSFPYPLFPLLERSRRSRAWPGLILCATLAVLSMGLAALPWPRSHGLGPLTLAIALGLLAGNTVYPRWEAVAADGVTLSKQSLLRWGVVLYGLRLTFQDVGQVGMAGVLIDALVLTSTFALAAWAGPRWLGLPREEAWLIGAGSAICGAAAVMATGPVLRARSEQVSVAVATVVVFGTLAMFLYPVLHRLGAAAGWSVDLFRFGVFTGSTVHEVAQVVVAGQALGGPAEAAAVITKLVRVMMLAPFLLALSAWRTGAAGGAGAARRISVPWFAFGFLLVAALNSLYAWPAAWHAGAQRVDDLLLAMAMAALGLTTRGAALRRAGARPLALAGLLWVWLLLGGAAINLGVQTVLG